VTARVSSEDFIAFPPSLSHLTTQPFHVDEPKNDVESAVFVIHSCCNATVLTC